MPKHLGILQYAFDMLTDGIACYGDSIHDTMA